MQPFKLPALFNSLDKQEAVQMLRALIRDYWATY